MGLLFGLLLLTLAAWPAHAADEVDPPDRAGRLAEINGQVWIYATDSNEWISAVRNRPVTSGDRLSTEADGRAEVRIGTTVLRVAPNTELEVVRLDDNHVSLHLHAGSVAARLRTREAANEFSLSTDEGRFRTDRTGSYRFDRNDDTSAATALSGSATYESDGTALAVQQGQRVEFWKDRGAPQYAVTDPRRDDFTHWVASLDAREARSVSTRYVSPEMTGVEDLDRYGRWEPETEYGAVWIPRSVAPGWAPYRMGHWAWVSPWGWTWVDDAPWGFAPFHYGRWVWFRNAWCWAPGRYVARPVYAPALVAWMGGPNVSVSISVGSGPTVGWFPLGPREVYVPAFRVSPRYVREVNVTHVTNITTIVNNPTRYMERTHYVNRGIPQAVTVVPSAVVERRQPVAPAFRPVTDRVLRDIGRERPRADAPVAAPPRVAPGARQQLVDPRNVRPGAPRMAPGTPQREVGGAVREQPPANVARPPEARPGLPRPQDTREGRDGRDGRDAREGGRDARDARDAREGRGRDAPPAQVQPQVQPQVQGQPAVVQPAAPAVPPRPVNEGRVERPPARVDNPRLQPAPVRPLPQSREADRPPAPVQEERRRRHDEPVQVPPRPQAPAQAQPAAPQPRVVAPPPVQVQPPAAPPQVVRPPVQRQHEAQPQAQPQPQRERERERPVERERGNGERGAERGGERVR